MKCLLTAITIVIVFGAIPAHAEETIQVYLPAAGWSVEIPNAGFETNRRMSGKTKDTLNLVAANMASELFLSAYIEPAEGEGGSIEARAFFYGAMKEAPIAFSDEKAYERGPLAIQEYTWREVEGVELNQRHLHIYLAHQGSWVDIHLSKVSFTEADRPTFDRIVEGVRLTERTESDLTSAEYILLGEQAAEQGLCEEADANFQVALAINKVKTQMKKEDYIGTLEALGICYGKNGEPGKALTTLQTAIKLDAEHANLHYNVACAHAELGDETAAVASLTAAYEKLEAHLYDLIPNPLEDSSFEAMKKNPEFKKIAKKIAKKIKKSEKELEKVFGKLKRLGRE